MEADPPPLRLALGERAQSEIRRTVTDQLRELDAWSEVGAATSFAAPYAPALLATRSRTLVEDGARP